MVRLLHEHFIERLAAPFWRFVRQEKSGVIVLGLCVLVAMVMANSPWSEEYAHLFEHKAGIVINGSEYLNYTLHHWINDGLMSMFFFVVGLELKREFIEGELSDLRNAILPIGAAVAGMIFPAIIYLAINGRGEAADGWGVPMATDIAFSLAILGVLGSKVPVKAKVFLTTLAIVDDLGAVLVIAFFYTSEISLVNIAVGAAFLGVMFIANKIGIKNIVFYGIVGIGGAWLAFLMSGIHATIAAVLAAFMIPASPRLEYALRPIVTFAIMPVFALANAGISFTGMALSDLFGGIALGVALGLFIGKPLGIVLSSLLLVKLGFVKSSSALTFRRLAGLGFLASIGFTMSMFISTLAFESPEQLQQAKAGIFLASILGGFVGYWLLDRQTSN